MVCKSIEPLHSNDFLTANEAMLFLKKMFAF